MLKRLGRAFGRESIKVIVVLQTQRLYAEIGVPVLIDYRKHLEERRVAAILENAKLASGWDVTWQIEKELRN
jgi:hypothetical protein